MMCRIVAMTAILVILLTYSVPVLAGEAETSKTEGVTSYSRETISQAVKIISSSDGCLLSTEQLSALYALGLDDNDIATLIELTSSASEKKLSVRKIAAVCIILIIFTVCAVLGVRRLCKRRRQK